MDDNEKGLANPPSSGFGFTNMNDRANGHGRACVVEDHPDGGTRVLWTVPANPPGDP